MKQHFNVNHAPIRRNRGGVKANARGYLLERLNQERFGDKPLWSPASYHRFFIAIKGSSQCFRVSNPAQIGERACLPRPRDQEGLVDRGTYIAITVLEDLADLEDVQYRERDVVSDHAAKS
jgi:hypothetical protein